MEVMRVIAAFVALTMVAACATPKRPYRRRMVPAKEIVVEPITDGTIVVQGRDQIAVQPDVDELLEAVECVPEAVEYAEDAGNMLLISKITSWVGYAASLAGVALLMAALIERDDRFLVAGLITLPFAAAFQYVERIPLPFAFTRTLDSINAYNDQYRVTAGCAPKKPRRQVLDEPAGGEPGGPKN
jgi:hypothetical protein